MLAVGIIGGILFLSTWLLGLILGFLIPPLGILLFGIALGGYLIIGPFLPLLVAQVSQAQALTTLNSITGETVVYGPGWHFRFPWETITAGDNISLEERTEIRDKLTIATKNDELKAKLSFQWRPEIEKLMIFRRLDDSTVNKGLFEAAERLTSSIFALLTAEQARANQSAISAIILRGFKKYEDGEKAKEAVKALKYEGVTEDVREHIEQMLLAFRQESEGLEESYGITVTQVNLSDVDFSEQVQKARSARSEHDSLLALYYEIAGDKEEYDKMSQEDKRKVRAEARAIMGKAREQQINFGNF